MDTSAPRLRRLLLTGAAGTLGRALAPSLRGLCSELVRSDLPAALERLGDPAAVPCDLADAAAVDALLAGVDAVVHLGGVSYERPWAEVLPANIQGLVNLYDAARRAGTRRIVFASSNHVTGAYAVSELIGTDDPPRPDGYYGVSKLFGEGLARLYHDRCGIETVCLRIGTATPEPIDRRSLASWISPRDLEQLVAAALTAPGVGFLVAWGCSDNPRRWWRTDEGWRRLGFTPRDSAETFAAKVEHITFPPGSPMAMRQGGSFLGLGPFDNPKETP